jgi:competence ComEA-like helix-hairpin-helix protein
VQNVGSKAAQAVLKIRVDRIPVGAKPVLVAHGRFPQGSLDGGKTKDASEELGKLTPGNYRVTVVLSDGKTDLDEKTADFTPTKAKSFFEKVKDKWPWLLLLLALAVIAWLLWRQRRKQKELETELERARMAQAGGAPRATAVTPPPPLPPPPAREPEPTAPSAGDRININTAGVEELMQLPGVGRRAAERIIAHREANGPFSSLEDLQAVEGWHGERIRRISDDAGV